jgi:hypothetical protein
MHTIVILGLDPRIQPDRDPFVLVVADPSWMAGSGPAKTPVE